MRELIPKVVKKSIHFSEVSPHSFIIYVLKKNTTRRKNKNSIVPLEVDHILLKKNSSEPALRLPFLTSLSSFFFLSFILPVNFSLLLRYDFNPSFIFFLSFLYDSLLFRRRQCEDKITLKKLFESFFLQKCAALPHIHPVSAGDFAPKRKQHQDLSNLPELYLSIDSFYLLFIFLSSHKG